MKVLLYLFVFASFLFADFSKLSSIEADFIQSVKPKKGKILHYEGNLKAKVPNFALWVYKSPFYKEIYVEKQKVTLYDKDLEQVTYASLEQEIDVMSLLKYAKKKDGYFSAILDSEYKIYVDKDDVLDKIIYKDKLGNDVEIKFFNVILNKTLSDSIFTFKTNLKLDVIKQ